MMNRQRSGARVLVALAWVLVLAVDAHAYLDPGTGSYVFQMVIAVVLSGAFTIKHFWHRLKARIVRREPAQPNDDAPAS
jgi:hypothetical protein